MAPVDDDAMNVYLWLDCAIMDIHPLSLGWENRTRKYTSLDPISTSTLKKNMLDVEEGTSLTHLLMRCWKFIGLLIDGWTEDGNHFVAVVAVTPSESSDRSYLLYMSSWCSPACESTTPPSQSRLPHAVYKHREVMEQNFRSGCRTSSPSPRSSIAGSNSNCAEVFQLKAVPKSPAKLGSVSRNLQTEGAVSLNGVRALLDHEVTHFLQLKRGN